jgi:hypothetical protein
MAGIVWPYMGMAKLWRAGLKENSKSSPGIDKANLIKDVILKLKIT